MTTPLVTVDKLTARSGDRLLLDGVSLELTPGHVTALVGHSGSGKTTTALALLGDPRPGVDLTGQVWVSGHQVVGADGVDLAACTEIRGGVVAYLPQHPGSSLNPARRIGSALSELAMLHDGDSTAALQHAQLPTERPVMRRFPHQFSGGQRQRVALANALACSPRVLILDEPTTGLDPETKLRVVDQLGSLARSGLAILLLSHDQPVVRALADDVVLLDGGRVKARGTPSEVLPEIRRPAVASARGPDDGLPPLLRVEGVHASYRRHKALTDVNLTLRSGECLGVVGGSGSGKTTLARCLAGLHDLDRGTVRLGGVALPPLGRRTLGQRRRVQYVWQEVLGSFDRRRTVLDQVARTAVRLRSVPGPEAERAAVELLARLDVPAETARRRPDGLSGGELQRAAIVRALLAEPDVLICDEITTSLDPANEQLVLDLLTSLRADRKLATVLISHDHELVHALTTDVLTLTAKGVTAHPKASRNRASSAA